MAITAGQLVYLQNVFTGEYLRVTFGLRATVGTRLSLDTIQNDYSKWRFLPMSNGASGPYYLQTMQPVTYPNGSLWQMNADVDHADWQEYTPIVIALGTPSQVWDALPAGPANTYYIRSYLGDFMKAAGRNVTFDLFMAAEKETTFDPNVGKTRWVKTRRKDLVPGDLPYMQWTVTNA